MSRPVNSFLNTLFGSADGADCCIRFQAAAKGAGEDASPVYIGEPLPSHKILLRGGSERLRAQIEHWVPLGPRTGDEQGNAAKRRCIEISTCTNANSSEQGPSQVGQFSTDASPRAELPELRVSLDSEDELQPTLDAIRFMYTGSIFNDAEAQPQQQQARQGQGQQLEDEDLSVAQLLLIRRQAEFLRVYGCAEACDTALEACFKRSPVAAVGNRSSSSSTASPLAPVLELYNFRHLLPTFDEKSRVRSFLTTCRTSLIQHWDLQLPESPEGTPRATKAQILVWLLGGGDVVQIVNNLELLERWKSLTPAALEELLQSDHVRTDDEATVVLLVETWMAAQGSAVTEADKGRVRRQLRLVNCSTCYLFDVLPKLPWLGPNPGQQSAFLARCRLSHRSLWTQYARSLGGYDTSSPWYGKPRPQSIPQRGVPYIWEVSREDVLAGLRKEGGEVMQLVAKLRGGRTQGGDKSRIVALGFEWGVSIGFKQGDAGAGVVLLCHVPSAIEAQAGRLQGGCNVSVRLGLCGEGAGGRACRPMVLKDAVVQLGSGVRWQAILPLEQVAGGQAAGGGQQQGQGQGGQAAGGGQQQQQGQGGQAAGGGQQQGPAEQAEGGGAKTEAELLAPWAKLLGPKGKIQGVLLFMKPAV